MKVSDYIARFVREQLEVDHVFGVVGGGSMHLNDSFRDFFIPMHGEQAAAMAADAYARLRGAGCALVTTGPGGTNAITGVACSWADSIPVLILSGQVMTRDINHGQRQWGVQGCDIVSMVSGITKYAVTVTRAEEIPGQLTHAVAQMKRDRPGPVWLDIPLDVQASQC